MGAMTIPQRPYSAIVGGSKISSKIGVIESLLEKVDILLLGGGMIFTFYKAQGLKVGSPLVEDDKIELAKTLMQKAKDKGVSPLLPTDVVIADKFAADANSKVVFYLGIINHTTVYALYTIPLCMHIHTTVYALFTIPLYTAVLT